MMISEKKMRGPHLFCRIQQDAAALSFRHGLFCLLRFGKMAVSVFHHDNGGIHEHADRKRQAAERHDVGADMQVVHRDEGRQHGDGQRQDRNQARSGSGTETQ